MYENDWLDQSIKTHSNYNVHTCHTKKGKGKPAYVNKGLNLPSSSELVT